MSITGFVGCRPAFAHQASKVAIATPLLCSLTSPWKRCVATFVRDRDTATSTPLLSSEKGLDPSYTLRKRPLRKLTSADLVRSLIVLSVSTLPKPLLLALVGTAKRNAKFIEHSRLLRWLMKKTFYEHFCIGSSQSEILSRTAALRRMGMSGIVLTYAREAPATSNPYNTTPTVLTDADSDLQDWITSNLHTIQMLTPGDYIALRVTGAGSTATRLLEQYTKACTQDCESPSSSDNISNDLKQALAVLQDGLRQICAEAKGKGVRVLIDAEGSRYQRAIDDMALNLMAEFNRAADGTRAIILNTYQLYLRKNIDKIKRHLQHSVENNYTLGLKLVRGAYMYDEADRDVIHASKQETDDAYDAAVSFLLSNTTEDPVTVGVQSNDWKADVVLATHNSYSVYTGLQQYVSKPGVRKRIRGLNFAQLMGMADELSFSLAAQLGPPRPSSEEEAVSKMIGARKGGRAGDGARTPQSSDSPEIGHPEVGVYKYTVWGTLSDCLLYLLRRAEENSDAVARSRVTVLALLKELSRRLVRFGR
ncbi:proline dehydrogenase [Exophiala oligosperma]